MNSKTGATRQGDLAKIHIARAQLGLDDDAYRQLLRTLCQVESASSLDYAGRQRLLKHFQACGWKPAPAVRAKVKQLADGPQIKMMRGLWIELHQAGKVREPSEGALLNFARRFVRPDRCDHLRWLSATAASQCIEALKQWRDRP